MAEGAKKQEVGRPVPTTAESLMWAQRIHKEEIVNARANPTFSLRNAVTVLDVPMKFKPGHIDPSQNKGLKPFDPADHGWDPQGPDATEFRRCMKEQVAGPRDRQAYPMTSAQEHGWLLMQGGEPVDRVRQKKCRLGFGWEWKAPAQYSQSTANPPPVYLAAGGSQVAPPAASSTLSAVAPPAPSRLSVCPPPTASVLSNSPPSFVSAARASQVSMNAPTEFSGISAASGSQLSRATSLPALNEHPADRLHRQEKKLGSAFKESQRFHKHGDRGQQYDKPLAATDVTKFDDDFSKAAGMPLYKTIGSQEVVLRNSKGVLANKWR